jgi:hypothetical protein
METRMTRTKPFKELVQRHVKQDRKFAEALLREGVDAMLSGDVDTGKTILLPAKTRRCSPTCDCMMQGGCPAN